VILLRLMWFSPRAEIGEIRWISRGVPVGSGISETGGLTRDSPCGFFTDLRTLLQR